MCYFTSSQIKIQKKVPTARLGSCPDPGLNRGHLDLQSNALPTELPRPTDGQFTGERAGAVSQVGGNDT